MANSNIKITGIVAVPGTNGSSPLRREVRDLQANFPDQWNLYLLGLDALQNMNENDITSYYQLAGIHGEPFKPWNGVNGLAGVLGGYCTHSSAIFLTWHRPYLALFEQVLYAIINDKASKFPDATRTKYVAAAKDFRIPYYDWAAPVPRGQASFPASLTAVKATFIDVDGKPKTIDNPLASFDFHPINPSREQDDLDEEWANYSTTVRYPDAKGQSDNGQVSAAVLSENGALRRNASLLLLSYKRYMAFSNNRWQKGEPGSYGSLENMHDNLHGMIGGGGHMGSLAVSAFDPVFWLHHCNVDRLWAVWQALNPDSYVEPGTNGVGSFTIQRGGVEDINTQLKPFWDKSGTTFWSSKGVKETTTFGYAYPETQSWKFPNSVSAYQKSVRDAVVKIYGSGNPVTAFVNPVMNVPQPVLHQAVPTAKQKAPGMLGTPANDASHDSKVQKPLLQQNDSFMDEPTPVPDKLSKIVKDKKYTEWITNLRAEKHGLNQTFQVYVFLGDFNSDPKTWPFEQTMVGRFTVLGRKADTLCNKCKNDAEEHLVITGTVPLTTALLQDIVDGKVSTLDVGEVETYLVRNLHWRVTAFDGSEIDRATVPGLKVSVCSTVVQVGQDDLPVYSGQYTLHPNVTDGRPAGHSDGDEV